MVMFLYKNFYNNDVQEKKMLLDKLFYLSYNLKVTTGFYKKKVKSFEKSQESRSRLQKVAKKILLKQKVSSSVNLFLSISANN